MKDPKELEIIEDIELEMAIQKELAATLEDSDKRLRRLRANLLEMRERPIIVAS